MIYFKILLIVAALSFSFGIVKDFLDVKKEQKLWFESFDRDYENLKREYNLIVDLKGLPPLNNPTIKEMATFIYKHG